MYYWTKKQNNKEIKKHAVRIPLKEKKCVSGRADRKET